MAWGVDVCPALAPAAEGSKRKLRSQYFEGVNRIMLKANHHDPEARHALIDLALLP